MTVSATFNDSLEIGGTGALGSESGWTAIAGIKSGLGTFGEKFASVDATAHGDSVRQNYKTMRDPDTINLVMNDLPADAGQVALAAAAADGTNAEYNFRHKEKDGAGTVIKTHTFKARVFSFLLSPANLQGVHERTAMIELSTAFTVA